MANYYSILGVSWSADIAAINSAYQRLEKRHNASTSASGDAASPRFERVRNAYEVLSDPIARQAYDSSLWRQRKLDRSRLARSISLGLIGAVAVSAMLVGFLPEDIDPQTLKSAIAAQSDRDDIVTPSKQRSALGLSKQDRIGPVDDPTSFDAKTARAGTAFREVLSDERLAAKHDRLITRFASRMIGPNDFDARPRVAALPKTMVDAPNGNNGATWHVEHGEAQLPLRNPQRSEPMAVAPSLEAPVRPQRPAIDAAARPVDKAKPEARAKPDAKPKASVGTPANPVPGADKAPIGAIAAHAPEAVRDTPEADRKPTGLDDGKIIPGASREALVVPAPRAFPKTWTRRRYAGVGLSLMLPDELFKPRMVADDGKDIVFATNDGRALLRIYARSGRGQIEPEVLRKRLATQRYGGAELSQSKILDDGFLLAGRIGGERFYERVYVRCAGRTLHAWMMVYPAAQHIFFDKIVAKLDQSYKPAAAGTRRCNG